jgi:hypothetical protein
MKLLLGSGTDVLPLKYVENRDVFKTGDLVLYRGTSFLAKGIQYFDNAYYNHIGVVVKVDEWDRVLTLDMWSQGLWFGPLSRRMAGYKDFCILRPCAMHGKVDEAIKSILQSWDGREIKYDTSLILRVAIIKKTGIDLTGLGAKSNFICSEFAQFYTHLLGLDVYDNINLITPQDFLRYKDENFTTLLDTAAKK